MNLWPQFTSTPVSGGLQAPEMVSNPPCADPLTEATMPKSATILIYGHDAQLLETRCMILERAGYSVLTATGLDEFERIPACRRVDLLLLCHSLSMEDCGRSLALAHSRWPQLKSLTLTSGAKRCFTSTLLEQTLDLMEGPAQLLSRIGKPLASGVPAPSQISSPLSKENRWHSMKEQ